MPGFKFEIVRAERVTMRGIDLDGKEIVLEGDDLLARMIQHEIDHLDGVLLLDRLEPDVRKAAAPLRLRPGGEAAESGAAPCAPRVLRNPG